MRFYILGKVFKRDDLTRSRITLDDAIVDNKEFFLFYFTSYLILHPFLHLLPFPLLNSVLVQVLYINALTLV